MAAVETFAIGGGCQILLVMDHVLAERSSFFNLPARKEGIIPGVANLRLWRLVGDRMARQAILFDRQFPADSPEGRLICDQVVPDGEMDTALEATIAALTVLRRRQRRWQPQSHPHRPGAASTCSASTWPSTPASKPSVSFSRAADRESRAELERR